MNNIQSINMSGTDFFGWQWFYRTIEQAVNKKDDLLVALAHFLLMKHSKSKCIGIGGDKTLSNDEEDSGSEFLPNNWNDDDNNYALRYTYDKKLYTLLALRTEGSLIITLLDVNTRKVSSIGLDAENLITTTKGNLQTMIPTVSQLAYRYNKELIEPVFSTRSSNTVPAQTSGASTSSSAQGSDSLRITRFAPYRLTQPSLSGRGDPGNLLGYPARYPSKFHINSNNGGIGPSAQPRSDPFGPPERGTTLTFVYSRGIGYQISAINGSVND